MRQEGEAECVVVWCSVVQCGVVCCSVVLCKVLQCVTHEGRKERLSVLQCPVV